MNKDGLVCCKDSDECAELFDFDDYHVPEPEEPEADDDQLTPVRREADECN